MNIRTDLVQQQIAIAKALGAEMKALFGDDDEQLIANTIEGETDLVEMLKRLGREIIELDMQIAGLKEHAAKVMARIESKASKLDGLKSLMLRGLGAAEMKKLEIPEGAFTRRIKPEVVVIDDEASIPTEFFTTPKTPDPRPDKIAIRRALVDGAAVPGCRLSEKGETLLVK